MYDRLAQLQDSATAAAKTAALSLDLRLLKPAKCRPESVQALLDNIFFLHARYREATNSTPQRNCTATVTQETNASTSAVPMDILWLNTYSSQPNPSCTPDQVPSPSESSESGPSVRCHTPLASVTYTTDKDVLFHRTHLEILLQSGQHQRAADHLYTWSMPSKPTDLETAVGIQVPRVLTVCKIYCSFGLFEVAQQMLTICIPIVQIAKQCSLFSQIACQLIDVYLGLKLDNRASV
jgi:hypothetical protein